MVSRRDVFASSAFVFGVGAAIGSAKAQPAPDELEDISPDLSIEYPELEDYPESGAKSVEPPTETPLEMPTISQEVREKSNRITRSRAEDDRWQQAQIVVDAHGKVDTNSELSEFHQNVSNSIDYNFRNRNFKFNPLHTEVLLNQAADLMDRASANRREVDSLLEKHFERMQKVKEHQFNSFAWAIEEEHGTYTFEKDRANIEKKAAKFLRDEHYDSIVQAVKINNVLFNPREKKRVKHYASLSAYWDARINTRTKTTDPDGQDSHSISRYVRGRSKVVPEGEFRRFSAPNFKSEMAHRQEERSYESAQAADYQFQQGLKASYLTSDNTYNVQKLAEKAETGASVATQIRVSGARSRGDDYAKAVTDKKGQLYVGDRVLALQKLIKLDVEQAIERMHAAEVGLRDVYRMNETMPRDVGSPMYIDNVIVWLRSIINKLVAFSNKDQATVLPVSVRQSGNWEGGVQLGRFKIDLGPLGLFRDMDFVRLRGISATAKFSDAADDLLLDLEIWPANPNSPSTRSNFAPVRLGRVTSRNSARNPDIVGLNTLNNINPDRAWYVVIKRVIGASDGADNSGDIFRRHVKDIFLDFSFAYQPK